MEVKAIWSDSAFSDLEQIFEYHLYVAGSIPLA